jgi:hypothetical protein
LSKASPPRPWVVAVAAFAIAIGTNTIFFAIDIPLGWGLRGSTHAPGGPSAVDIRMEHVLYAAFVVTVVINLGLPIGIAIARKWIGLVGVAVAWAATPLAFVGALAIDSVVVRLVW